jgi:hypothetical protein
VVSVPCFTYFILSLRDSKTASSVTDDIVSTEVLRSVSRHSGASECKIIIAEHEYKQSHYDRGCLAGGTSRYGIDDLIEAVVGQPFGMPYGCFVVRVKQVKAL